MRVLFLVGLTACATGPDPCACPADIVGHGVQLESQCACLPLMDTPADPDAASVFYVDADSTGGDGTLDSPWPRADWAAIDAALAAGHVHVVYDTDDVWDDRLDVNRTDDGPNRVLLDGGGGSARATVPGVHTGFDPIPRHRVTVRGFEVTGSRDKGVLWIGGDGVIIEDNVVHDNRGTPSISLEYSNRTGFVSHDFVLRNNHVYDQTGECVYIGGAEGEDEDSHVGVVVENNLIHDCRSAIDSKHDGINIKDRITDVVVRRNVVVGGDWGIEVASQGVYSGNITIDAGREGFHVTDGFQALPDMVFVDNVSMGAGDEGMQLTANNAETGSLSITGLTIIGAGDSGITVGGSFDVTATLTDVAILGSPVGFDGWGQGDITIERCVTDAATQDHDRQFDGATPCGDIDTIDVSAPAGADNVFFTDDDVWWVPGGALLERE